MNIQPVLEPPAKKKKILANFPHKYKLKPWTKLASFNRLKGKQTEGRAQIKAAKRKERKHGWKREEDSLLHPSVLCMWMWLCADGAPAAFVDAPGRWRICKRGTTDSPTSLRSSRLSPTRSNRAENTPIGTWSYNQPATGYLKDSFQRFPSDQSAQRNQWRTNRKLVLLLMEEHWLVWFQQVFLWGPSKVNPTMMGNIYGYGSRVMHRCRTLASGPNVACSLIGFGQWVSTKSLPELPSSFHTAHLRQILQIPKCFAGVWQVNQDKAFNEWSYYYLTGLLLLIFVN